MGGKSIEVSAKVEEIIPVKDALMQKANYIHFNPVRAGLVGIRMSMCIRVRANGIGVRWMTSLW